MQSIIAHRIRWIAVCGVVLLLLVAALGRTAPLLAAPRLALTATTEPSSTPVVATNTPVVATNTPAAATNTPAAATSTPKPDDQKDKQKTATPTSPADATAAATETPVAADGSTATPRPDSAASPTPDSAASPTPAAASTPTPPVPPTLPRTGDQDQMPLYLLFALIAVTAGWFVRRLIRRT